MRLLHTSDWHLGHVLHEHGRHGEHQAFLDWLRAQLAAHEVDALLLTGDVFDTANPSAEAQRLFFDFVVQARQAQPELAMVVIGGNHDSPARLDAPAPLLASLGVSVVGGLPALEDRDRVIVPIRRKGEVLARVAAVPFLRISDLPPTDAVGADRLVEGVRAVYADAMARARKLRRRGEHLLAMGHCYLAGTQLSELSERRILGGNQHALPADLFPEELDYVALGHLHRAQRVGRETMRYAGSPIPLALDEVSYPHQVMLVDLEGGDATLRPLRVPRTAEILRVPESGSALPDAILEACARLPARDPAMPEHQRPFLQVVVRLERPDPGFAQRLAEVLEDRAARLASIKRESLGTGQALGDGRPAVSLRELAPEEVFRARWRQDHPGEVPDELLQAFHELVEAVHQEDR